MIDNISKNSPFERNFRQALLVPEFLIKLEELRLMEDGSDVKFIEDILYKLYLIAALEIHEDLDLKLKAGAGSTVHEKLRSTVRTQITETLEKLDKFSAKFFTDGVAARSLEESLDIEIERFVANKKRLLDDLYAAYCTVAAENNAQVKQKKESRTLAALQVQVAAMGEA